MVTPQTESPRIAQELGIPKLYFKREDLHPYGSHKGRSIPAMIDAKLVAGARSFAISSSGNAALAAIRHIKTKNSEGEKISLKVFIGENINPKKRQVLIEEAANDPHITIDASPRPLQALFNVIKGEKAESLRQSNDPSALVGYESLAREIIGTPDLEAVFIATSSGTAAQAIGEYFIKENKHVEVHIVQTTSTAPFAKAWSDEDDGTPSIADAIVDKIAHRKDPLLKAVSATRGKGWIASNELIERAMNLLSKEGIEVTPNGALSLAGLMKAVSKGKVFKGAVICVITGK
jgi:threonine synthase